MTEPGRVITAMVTPFRRDGAVDYAQAKALAKALLASGSDGLVVSGTTGEAPTLTREEKLRLFAEIKQTAGEWGAVIANTGNYNTAESIELTKAAEATSVDAALLVVPYYNKPTQEGLYQHFRAIADATKLPCILYNVPSRTVANLAAETVIRLSKVANIVGVKEASGDIAQIGAIIEGVTRRNFRVWSGNDADTLALMLRGGYGVVSVASHIAGNQIKQLVHLAAEGNKAQAEELHNKLTPLFTGLFVSSNPIPVKHALNYLGFPVGGLRLPMTPADPKTAAQVEGMLKSTKIDLQIPGAKAAAL